MHAGAKGAAGPPDGCTSARKTIEDPENPPQRIPNPGPFDSSFSHDSSPSLPVFLPFRLTIVIIFANFKFVSYSLEYFHPRVKAEIESWPDDLLADFARMVELLMDFGPSLGMPHSRAMGSGLFELRPRGREGIGRVFYCFVVRQRIVILHAFIKKTQGTPEQELRIARRRMKEVQNG
jgi:phage-related protein